MIGMEKMWFFQYELYLCKINILKKVKNFETMILDT